MKNLVEASRIIRRHYNLNRQVSPSETRGEIDNLLRKRAHGNLDDSQEKLLAKLDL